MTPQVSVVLPTHDRAHLLRAAAMSVLTQTFDDLELVIVDDGSTDRTPDVVADLAASDPRVRPVRLPVAGGAPAARNAGLAASSAPLVAYIDDDDEWLPQKLARQVAVLDGAPEVAVVGCHHVLVDGAGRAVPYRGPVDVSPPDLLWANFLGGASNVVVRRSAVEPFDPEYRTCQDWDHWVRCAARGEVRVVPEPLVRYRDAGGDRLTASRPARLAGHRRFAERHGAAMTAWCRAYHRARRRLLEASSQLEELRTGPALLARTPPRVALLLAGEIAAARVGAAVGDPARGLRRLHREACR